jgi:single-strand DNA-binding protein
MSNQVALAGNITQDIELRYTQSGKAVAKFNLAVNERYKKNDEWVDGDPMFMAVSVWGDQAENVAESLTKGSRVVVIGKLKTSSWENADGEKRSRTEMEAVEVGAALKWATATVEKRRSSAA